MSKQVQIEWSLFCDLWDYFYSDNAPMDSFADEIRKQLTEKLDKIINRELFSRYKRSPMPSEREKWRQAYLDRKGVFESFRTPSEWHMDEPPEES